MGFFDKLKNALTGKKQPESKPEPPKPEPESESTPKPSAAPAAPEPEVSSVPDPEPATQDSDDSDADEQKTYTVQSGDTLWKIAESHYGDGSKYTKIFEANRPMLEDPDNIHPGQELVIPKLDD